MIQPLDIPCNLSHLMTLELLFMNHRSIMNIINYLSDSQLFDLTFKIVSHVILPLNTSLFDWLCSFFSNVSKVKVEAIMHLSETRLWVETAVYIKSNEMDIIY
jgi:hypothetical protein